jgi:hypothetical protein
MRINDRTICSAGGGGDAAPQHKKTLPNTPSHLKELGSKYPANLVNNNVPKYLPTLFAMRRSDYQWAGGG